MRESGDRTTGQQCRDDKNGEEQEEVDEISFRLVARVDRDAVDYLPP